MTSNGKFSLYHKNVILTGASGGLGREMTLRLTGKYQCRVLGVGRSEEKLQALAAALGERADQFEYRVCDVSRPEDWRALAAYVKSGSFPADVLINNAGILPPFARFGNYTAEEIEAAIRTNWGAVLYSMQEFVPLFDKMPRTAIINIATSDALCPLAGTSLYSAGKAAVCALSEAMREEYRGKIYLPAVCPGFIRTYIMKHQRRAVSPLVNWVSMPAPKAARIILRRVNAGRSRIVVGADAHLMSAAYRLAPVLSLRFFRWFFQASGLELFQDIYE